MGSLIQPQSNLVIAPDMQSLRRQKLTYGDNFPGFKEKDGTKWKVWLEGEYKRQDPTMQDKRLHWARHRNFRSGRQWITTRDGRQWREPKYDKNTLRNVLNIFGPALDFRLGIIAEQRPGFRYETTGVGVNGREAAEAQQAVAEYYFFIQRAWLLFLDAAFHAQTDGVSFVHVYIDKNAGPMHDDVTVIGPEDERFMGLLAQGYELDEASGLLLVPLAELDDPSAEPAFLPPGSQPRQFAEGDLSSRVVLAHETLVDPEARTLNGPIDPAKFFIVRRLRDINSVKLELGDKAKGIEFDKVSMNDDPLYGMPDSGDFFQRGLPPYPTRRIQPKDAVPEYYIYFSAQKDSDAEMGKFVRVIGNQVVDFKEELPGGIIPFARFTDGSSDADFYPRPICSDYCGDQMAINALVSTQVGNARLHGAGRLIARKGSILEESFTNILGSVVEYTGDKPEPMSSPVGSNQVDNLLGLFIKQLENKTGWNDIARGQVSNSGSSQDVSGRALLAQRELFERTFGPAVRATAEGATEWAQIIVKMAQWLFDTPRMIPVVGRPDLAKRIDKTKLGTRPVVYCDPETLMPLPRALRQQMLTEMLMQGLITLDTYAKRSPYAEVRSVHMGDLDQWNRAQWVNTILEEKWKDLVLLPPEQLYAPLGVPILYQDQPQVHKVALNELILDERKPWGLKKLAQDRWMIYDIMEQSQMSQGMIPMPLEVIGTPPIVQVMPVSGQMGAPGGQPPGTPATGGANPALGGAGGIPQPSSDSAQPLGSFGQVEEAAQ